MVNIFLTIKVKDTAQTVLKSSWNEENDYLNIDLKFVNAWKSHDGFKNEVFVPKDLQHPSFYGYCFQHRSLQNRKVQKVLKVNRQQPRSARLRPIQKIPTPIKLLISPLPEMINQICKKYSLENSQDKKTSDDTCDTFQK